MPQVSDIRASRRRRGRVNVFLDGEFWTGMSADCHADLGFVVGDQLTAESVAEAEAHIMEMEALGYCLRALSARARTAAQLADGLRRREFSEALIDVTLARCEELLLLDDEQYASSLIADRLERGYGMKRVEMALKDAGIDRELAEELMSSVREEDVSAATQRALRSKFSGPQSYHDVQRAKAFLMRRGFSMDDIPTAVAHIDVQADRQQSRREIDVQKLTKELVRKYPGVVRRDRSDVRKAWGWLARRGVPGGQVSEILDEVAD
jgi:SOS response regulatory protein OraA/RecX